jgi:hypothetical protein
MELAAGQGGYRQLAEEIGEVLQAAAETAEKMQEEARADAARIRAEAEGERRTACAEGRRILDEARMEADMVRAEAEWQAQEIIAQARRQATERAASTEARLNEAQRAQLRVLDRLAGVGQVLADALATLREGADEVAAPPPPIETMPVPRHAADDDDDDADADRPSAKVYFVEFPPLAPAAPSPPPAYRDAEPEPEPEIVLPEPLGASLFAGEEHSEWAPPPEMPTWWTRGGAQG